MMHNNDINDLFSNIQCYKNITKTYRDLNLKEYVMPMQMTRVWFSKPTLSDSQITSNFSYREHYPTSDLHGYQYTYEYGQSAWIHTPS